MKYQEVQAGQHHRTGHSGYDRNMIRDFLSHLLWDLRAAVFDAQQHTGTCTSHPELDEVLDRYFQKYHVGLLPLTVFDHKGATAAQVRAAHRTLRTTLTELRQQQLELLEALSPLFEEALECATSALWRQDQIPIRVLKSRKIKMNEGDETFGPSRRESESVPQGNWASSCQADQSVRRQLGGSRLSTNRVATRRSSMGARRRGKVRRKVGRMRSKIRHRK
jgi:hypothetical protein